MLKTWRFDVADAFFRNECWLFSM